MTDRIVKTIIINAAPEEVWPHLVEKDKLARWFQTPRGPMRQGEDYYFEPSGENGAPVYGRVVEMVPPERMVWTFDHSHLNHETTVTFTLVAKNGGTELTLVHEGFAGAPGDVEKHARDHDEGWNPHLAALRANVENQ